MSRTKLELIAITATIPRFPTATIKVGSSNFTSSQRHDLTRTGSFTILSMSFAVQSISCFNTAKFLFGVGTRSQDLRLNANLWNCEMSLIFASTSDMRLLTELE